MSKRLENKVAIVFGAGLAGPGWGHGKAAASITGFSLPVDGGLTCRAV